MAPLTRWWNFHFFLSEIGKSWNVINIIKKWLGLLRDVRHTSSNNFVFQQDRHRCTSGIRRSSSEHVNGAWVADLPLGAQACYCDIHSTASRSMLCSHSSVFWNVRSPLLSRSPDFLPAPLHSLLYAHALVLTCAGMLLSSLNQKTGCQIFQTSTRLSYQCGELCSRKCIVKRYRDICRLKSVLLDCLDQISRDKVNIVRDQLLRRLVVMIRAEGGDKFPPQLTFIISIDCETMWIKLNVIA